MKRTYIVFVIILIFILPLSVSADSHVAGVVTIDAAGGDVIAGKLQSRVEAQTGGAGTGPVNTKELHVTADGAFNAVDIAFINSLLNMRILNTANSIAVGDVGDGFLQNNTNITEVILPATTFGINAFMGTSALDIVNLPKTTRFGNSAFVNSGTLSDIDIPIATFYGATCFHQSKITNFELNSPASFERDAFSSCSDLISLSLPNAKRLGMDFCSACSNLKKLSIPSVTVIKDDFCLDCDGLTKVSIPSVTRIGSFFCAHSDNLTSVSTPRATEFGIRIFNGCPLPIEWTLGRTVPTVISFAPGIPIGGSIIRVPKSAKSKYDTDPNDNSGTNDDGLWFDWEIRPIIVSNPQTGDTFFNRKFWFWKN